MLQAPTAVSNARTGLGGLHLGVAGLAVIGLSVPRWRTAMLGAIVTISVAVISVRIASLAVDGLASGILKVFGIEAASFAVQVLGLLSALRSDRGATGVRAPIAGSQS